MSSTLLIPISYCFVRDEEGDLVLHPAIKCKPVIVESNSLIKAESTFQFTTGDGSFYQVEFGKAHKDDFFDAHLVFTGFRSTGLTIIQELNVPANEVEWY